MNASVLPEAVDDESYHRLFRIGAVKAREFKPGSDGRMVEPLHHHHYQRAGPAGLRGGEFAGFDPLAEYLTK